MLGGTGNLKVATLGRWRLTTCEPVKSLEGSDVEWYQNHFVFNATAGTASTFLTCESAGLEPFYMSLVVESKGIYLCYRLSDLLDHFRFCYWP